jgi:uncharacterized protein with NRDE domain
MCLVAIFFRVFPEAPVVGGANREEFYRRGGEPPRLLDGAARSVAGLDPVAGGTWLGVNEHGVLIAVTNRRKSLTPEQPLSRGRLAATLLASRSAAEAVDRAVRELEAGRYNGCNLVCLDSDRAVVVQGGDWLRVRPLPPGLHLLTNGDVNDPADPRLAYAGSWLSQRPIPDARSCVAALKQLCALHEPGLPALCFRAEERGTVSSCIVALFANLADSIYLHAQGPPDVTPYGDFSALLRELVESPNHLKVGGLERSSRG